jgi:hypothetical protein
MKCYRLAMRLHNTLMERNTITRLLSRKNHAAALAIPKQQTCPHQHTKNNRKDKRLFRLNHDGRGATEISGEKNSAEQ